ncbi:hypothetical protein VTO42DRAFT_6037 [Malbranchea cinnamomea]
MASSPPVSPSSPNEQRPHSSSASSPIPPPIPVETHPNRVVGFKPHPLHHQHPHQHQHQHQRLAPDRGRLAPEDAYYAHSLIRPRPPPHHATNHAASLRVRGALTGPSAAAVAALRPPPAVPGPESKPSLKEQWASGRRRKRRKKQWKKLLWVKQSYPDNYTDTETFLDHLQRNPRLRPYEFWPLVADFTVIVQHVCSVIIFVCCFTVIFQERVSPVSVVSWASVCTILGWVLWDFWVSKEHREAARLAASAEATGTGMDEDSSSSSAQGLALALNDLRKPPSRQNTGDSIDSQSTSRTSVHSAKSSSFSGSPGPEGATNGSMAARYNSDSAASGTNTPSSASFPSSSSSSSSSLSSSSSSSFLSPRNRHRLATAKSAFLIFCALRGLSPILKSLTKSTTSDSIWAMSCWLMIINVFFFDYSTGDGSTAAAKFPASLSTNAALMASTVLASRLKSTTHVFSLTLFSIEVFGLFPVFRRHLRAISWRGHVLLTVVLVIAASAAVGITLRGGYSGAILGVFIGGPATAIAMGGCSWWLISLQKYKNVVTGPWDTAKPIIRRHWD